MSGREPLAKGVVILRGTSEGSFAVQSSQRGMRTMQSQKFVVPCTVVACAGERVLRFRDGVATNLCQRLCEVVIVFAALVVVDFCEGCVVVFESGVRWYGIGEGVAEVEVEEDLAGAIWVDLLVEALGRESVFTNRLSWSS
jgi:hypothetical protein